MPRKAIVLWWLVNAVWTTAQYAGPYRDAAMCDAARKAAIEFGTLADCVPTELIDGYLTKEIEYFEMGGGGNT